MTKLALFIAGYSAAWLLLGWLLWPLLVLALWGAYLRAGGETNG